MRRISWLVLTLGLTSACAKRYSTDPQPKKASKVNLTGLTTEKIVRTKYEGLKVVCTMNAEPSGSASPIELAMAEWNILQEFADSRSLEFSAQISETVRVDIVVQLDRLTILPNVSVRDDAGSEYVMKNSPTIQARLDWRHTVGTLIQKGITTRIAMTEGLPTALVSLNTTVLTAEPADQIHRLRIQCETIAKPKPEYADEFTKR